MDARGSIYRRSRTCYPTFAIFKIFVKALSFENKSFKLDEPFKGLFTQGMVCHETYKDNEGKWLSPEEIEIVDGKKVLKTNNSIKINVGPSESMSKSKKYH